MLHTKNCFDWTHMYSFSQRPWLTALTAVCGGLLLSTAAAAATLTLDPLLTGSAPNGTSAGGLTGNWYKLQNDARFSTASYTDENGRTDQFQNFSWGTGIWAASDIAAIAAGQNPYVVGTATSTGAVSYANNIYNNTQASGAYGTWGADYARTLAPIVGGANNCPLQSEAETTAECSGEFNYAAVFSGYLYVAEAGLYDFGIFADDGFNFQLSGLNGGIGLSHNTVAGSTGRGLYELLAQNNLDGLYLAQGYYGIDLSYFNRLESGVIDLGWHGPGATAWRTITPDDLYNRVPEPATLALSSAAMLGMWGVRRRRLPAARSQS
jgi:hypothetical protein